MDLAAFKGELRLAAIKSKNWFSLDAEHFERQKRADVAARCIGNANAYLPTGSYFLQADGIVGAEARACVDHAANRRGHDRNPVLGLELDAWVGGIEHIAQ